MEWAQLQEAVAGCTACGLCKGRKNAVLGVGSQQARWLVVGEAPGEQEDLRGEPFVGPSGQLLDNMLRSIGLNRAAPGREGAVYIANVIKCRPPGNRNPEPGELAQCAPFLRRQIELLQPDMILALGKFAAYTLLEGSVPQVQAMPLGKLRQAVHRYQAGERSIPVVVSYHPAYLLRSLGEKAKAWADLCLAMGTLKADPLGKILS